tara:strand:+ start:2092 stop:2307 length:216 start_codon:yes stop_codon:yes gene_type:complete
MTIYDKTILKLISFEGFNQRFEQNMRVCNTYKNAYLKTEEQYKDVFGEKKYASYDSFRIVRARKMKKNKKK